MRPVTHTAARRPVGVTSAEVVRGGSCLVEVRSVRHIVGGFFRAERGDGSNHEPAETLKTQPRPAKPSQRVTSRTTTRTPTTHVNWSPQPGNHSTYAFPVR
jgi:hypothetical protein